MTHRSLLDYLGSQPEQPAPAEKGDAYPVDLRARIARLEERIASAAAEAAAEKEAVAPHREIPLTSQIENILRRRGFVSERGEARESTMAEDTAYPDHGHERPRAPRVSVEAPPIAPSAALSNGDFGRFVDAVQMIAQAAGHYLEHTRAPSPIPLPKQAPEPRHESDFAVLAESLKQVLVALHGTTEEFRATADEMRRLAQDDRRPADERHPGSRRISRDDGELYRLQDDLDDLRERLASVTRRRSRNPY